MVKAVKKFMFGVIALATVCTAVTATAAPAFAAPAPWREGSEVYSVELRESTAPIDIAGVKITLNAPHFPMLSDNTDLNYRANVTLEYSLANNTEGEATADILLRALEPPYGYFKEGAETRQTVKVDGEEITPTVRYGKQNGLHDEMLSDGFYTPDTPVHTFKISYPANVHPGYFKGSIIKDAAKARYCVEEREGTFTTSVVNTNFYIIGDTSAVDFSQAALYSVNNVKMNAEYEVVEVEAVTLKDFVLKYKPADLQASDIDYYNFVYGSFSNTECMCETEDIAEPNLYRLKKYYEYSVTIAPNSGAVTSVTSPIYPNVSFGNYVNADYTFDFSGLSQGWNSLGRMEAEINTPFGILSGDVYQKTDTGFKATFDKPGSLLQISLYNPASGDDFDDDYAADMTVVYTVLTVLIILAVAPVIAGVIALIVVLVKNKKRKDE